MSLQYWQLWLFDAFHICFLTPYAGCSPPISSVRLAPFFLTAGYRKSIFLPLVYSSYVRLKSTDGLPYRQLALCRSQQLLCLH